jgi:hypothetical protein
MVTTMSATQTRSIAPARVVLPMPDLAKQLSADALARARQKMALAQREEELKNLLALPAFIDAFVHALAIGIAGALAENDLSVQAVYAHDPSLNPDSESGDVLSPSGTVHLLVQVTRSSAALEAFIASLDQALTAQLHELPSPKFAQRTSVLDINLLTEEGVRLGTGYAALLSSVFAPPIKVWHR